MTATSNGNSVAVQSPSSSDVGSPTADSVAALQPDNTDKVQMKKQLGLIEGIAIILGVIFGSGNCILQSVLSFSMSIWNESRVISHNFVSPGIFVSPKGVIKEVNAVGTSLVIWVICGFLSMIGALCYAELGTSIPLSGGDYAYINKAYGGFPAFLYLWDALFIFVWVQILCDPVDLGSMFRIDFICFDLL